MLPDDEAVGDAVSDELPLEDCEAVLAEALAVCVTTAELLPAADEEADDESVEDLLKDASGLPDDEEDEVGDADADAVVVVDRVELVDAEPDGDSVELIVAAEVAEQVTHAASAVTVHAVEKQPQVEHGVHTVAPADPAKVDPAAQAAQADAAG